MFVLKLPRFFTRLYGEEKREAISKCIVISSHSHSQFHFNFALADWERSLKLCCSASYRSASETGSSWGNSEIKDGRERGPHAVEVGSKSAFAMAFLPFFRLCPQYVGKTYKLNSPTVKYTWFMVFAAIDVCQSRFWDKLMLKEAFGCYVKDALHFLIFAEI